MIVKHDIAKLIVWDNCLVGYKLYRTGGIYNSLIFVGYHWLI